MRQRNASSPVRLRGAAGVSGQGHTATWEHCAHLLAPVGVMEDTVSHSPQRWQVCERWEAGYQGSRLRSQRASHLFPKGFPDFQRAGADTALVVHTERFLSDRLPRVVRKDPFAEDHGIKGPVS